MSDIYISTAVLIFLTFTLLWFISLWRGKTSFIDACWGPGFALIAWATILLTGHAAAYPLVVAGLVSVWALRLGGHLLLRFLREGEDPRYLEMRDKAGARWWWWRYFSVFLLQGAAMWTVSLPVQAAIQSGSILDGRLPLAIIGGGLAVFGLVFEGTADRQLDRFRKDPANHGRLMDRGLWAWSRHPNYFGNACLWWGLYLLGAASGGTWTIFSPILMTVLLLQVSGVHLLEKRLTRTKIGFEAYRQRTSAFIPWRPRPPGA